MLRCVTPVPNDESGMSGDPLTPNLGGGAHQARVVDHELRARTAPRVPLTDKHVCKTTQVDMRTDSIIASGRNTEKNSEIEFYKVK